MMMRLGTHRKHALACRLGSGMFGQRHWWLIFKTKQSPHLPICCTQNDRKGKEGKLIRSLGFLFMMLLLPAWVVAADDIYALNNQPPYQIYEVNPAQGTMVTVGYLLFSSSALARHPDTGELYYVEREPPYRVAKWNPNTHQNTLIHSGSNIPLTPRLDFSSNGHLYATRFGTNQLYEIDIATGNPSLVGTISGANLSSNSGDILFDGNDHLFLVQNSYLYRIDFTSLEAEYVGNTGVPNLAGLAWDEDEEMVACNIFSSGSYICKINEENAHVERYRYSSRILYDLAGHPNGDDDDEFPIIQVTKAVDSDSLTAGSVATYSIIISNSGEGDGHVTLIQDNLPASFTYIPGSTSGITDNDPVVTTGNNLQWNGSWTLEDEYQFILNFRATVGGSRGNYFNSVLVEGNNFTPVESGPVAPVQVIAPNLSLTILVDKGSTQPGDTLTYQIVYLNTGDDRAESVIILESIPEYTQFLPGTVSGENISPLYSLDGGTTYQSTADTTTTDIQFRLNTVLEPGESGLLTYKVRVD